MPNLLRAFLANNPQFDGLPIVRRGRGNIHLRRADGQVVALCFGAPIHYQDESGEWREIDTSLRDMGDGDPFDLTGYDIRYEAQTSTPIVKDVDTGGILCSDPTSGEFTIEFEPGDTSALTITGTRLYPHECRIEDSGGNQYVIFRGNLIIREALFTAMDDET